MFVVHLQYEGNCRNIKDFKKVKIKGVREMSKKKSLKKMSFMKARDEASIFGNQYF